MLDELIPLSRQILNAKFSPYRRYLIQNENFNHRLSILLGSRGVGKTTMLVQHLLQEVSNDYLNPSILYVPVDHFLVGSKSIYEIADEFYKMGGKWLALDEIHKIKNWSQELKSIYDTFPKLNLLVSGSSSLKIHQGSHDLSRRALKYQLFGLSFREFLELQCQFSFKSSTLEEILKNHEKIASQVIDVIEKSDQKILSLFKDYLSFGYFPYFLEFSNKDQYLLTLEQNMHTTLEQDLTSIYPDLTGATIYKIKQLLLFIAKSVPFTPNWNKIKEILDIGDARTVKTYFHYLEDAGLIRMVSGSGSKLNRVEQVEKVYLDNPNQMRALSAKEPLSGTQRELFFLNMLSVNHKTTLAIKGDFIVDELYHFEVGGSKKTFKQIHDVENSFLACDDIEIGIGKKIPLWVFGFLY